MFKKYSIIYAIIYFVYAIEVVHAENNVEDNPDKGSTSWNFTLRSDNDPSSTGWKQPAHFSYTVNTKGKDSFAAAIAASLALMKLSDESESEWQVASKVKWIRDNQQTSEQNHLQLGIGIGQSSKAENDLSGWQFVNEVNAFYNREAVFADLSKSICSTNLSSPLCNTQYKESLRLVAQTSPFNAKSMEPDFANYFLSWEPLIGIFHDDIINKPINPKTGNRITGSVSGGFIGAGVAIVPRFDGSQWVFRIEGRVIKRFLASTQRKDNFTSTAAFLTVSLDYSLVGNAEKAMEKGFFPTIGIQYKEGQDPLSGRKKQSSVVVGLRLKY